MVLLHRTHSPANRAWALEIIRQFDEFEGVSKPVKPAGATNGHRRDQIFFRPRKQQSPDPHRTDCDGTCNSSADHPEHDLTKVVNGDGSRNLFCGSLQYNYLPIVRHDCQPQTNSEPLHPGQRCLMHAYLKVLDTRTRAPYSSRSTRPDLAWRLQLTRSSAA